MSPASSINFEINEDNVSCIKLQYLWGTLEPAQDTLNKVLSTREIYLFQRVEEQGGRDKDRNRGLRRRGRKKEREVRVICPRGRDKVRQDREETETSHSQMEVYKGKRGDPF